MKILGINNYFEHPAVALIIDGELVFAVEDERFTRIKHGKIYTPYKTFIPYNAIYATLKSHNLTFKDLDEVAFSYSRKEHIKGLLGCFTGRRISSFREELSAFRSASNIWKALKSGYELPQKYRGIISPTDVKNVAYKEWDHHVSHAASAFFCSGFTDSLIVVADGSGEIACTSIYIGKGKNIHKIAQISLPNSLGFFYSFITKHLGFEPFSDEYKVMGLAAYGEDKYRTEMEKLVENQPNGKYVVNMQKLYNLSSLLGEMRPHDGLLEQRHKDIARSAQNKLEETLEHIVRYFMQETDMNNLCLAGGIFLNILANARLVELSLVKNFFIQPASHDAGTAIGAAALSWVNRGGKPQIDYPSMFLGTEYDDHEIEKVLTISNVKYELLDKNTTVIKLAGLLAKENIIALYRGRMEFGPRALGNRSLLASPKSRRTHEKLNELKVREQFRPLAPLVTFESFEKYFIGKPSRYMMLTVKVREEAKQIMPAVVHQDGTARTQVIYKEHDEFLFNLLKTFENQSGIPVLINTSMNVRGKPIDENPYDALATFLTSGIDYLMIGNFLIKNPSF